MVNSLEVTLTVTVISVLFAYPFAWILAEVVPARLQRLALSACAVLASKTTASSSSIRATGARWSIRWK